MSLQSINPATEEVVNTFEELTDEQVKQKLELANKAYSSWRTSSFEERAEKLNKVAEILRRDARSLGEVLTREMGKPILQAVAEVEKCAWVCEYYAQNAKDFLADEIIETDASKSYVKFDPIGVVLAVMPWNFPYWQVFRFIAPASMAGNVGVLKHASNVQEAANKIEDVFKEAGYPEGVFQNLQISSSKVESIIRNDVVKAVTLTGSEGAGIAVAKVAGEEIKKTVLELGGSDPFIVFEDADVDVACATAVSARNLNNGQSCIAAKRFIVVESIAEQFIAGFKKRFEDLKVGDPSNEENEIGPVVNKASLEEITQQVDESIKQGATLVTGGKRVFDKGYFYAPTILSDLKPGMRAYHEELFGPVASVIIVKDEAQAIQVANSTIFGLGSSVWTSDEQRAKRIIPQIDAGAVFVNGLVKSDPRLPFGGEKKSGYGRELSKYGIKEFVNIKSVWIK